ncbi:hypothetical protein V2K98_11385 [Pseudomonas alliivorans]|nr:hypothetical protein [Pseudomonas alliivorans]MEE4649323.1 hypothetical protein [Pseudomonas alliivorans]
MAVTSNVRRQLNTTLHHELGHWLVARHFNFNVGQVSVRCDGRQLFGTSHIEPYSPVQLKSAESVYAHVFNRMVVLCAGVVADIATRGPNASQTVIDNAYTKGVMDATGLNDRGKVDELMYILLSIKHEPSSDAVVINDRAQLVFGEAYGRASELISGFFPKIEEMAKRLMKGQENSLILEFKYEELVRAEERAIDALLKRNEPLPEVSTQPSPA